MRIIVTGSTGFVGSAIVDVLANQGHEVIAGGGPNSSAKTFKTGANAFYKIDITEPFGLSALEHVGKIDALVHAAGIAHRFGKVSDDEFQKVNVLGVKNVANLAAKLKAKHFLLISSVLVYGRTPDREPIKETAECQPIDSYAQSKLDGENACTAICTSTGIRLTILRPAPIIGEGSRGNVARLIRVIDNHRFLWIGNGVNVKSLVYVRDVARAASACLESSGEAAVFNVVGETVSVKHLVDQIARQLGKSIPRIRFPASPAKGLSKLAASVFPLRKVNDMRRSLDTWLSDAVYSGDAIRTKCGFEAEVNLPDAIEREVKHYLGHK